MKYTENQEKAINSRGRNLLILACAGSGKTEVISRRIAQLVKDGVYKNEIIAFAFTEKAAAELKARIRKHMEEVNASEPSLGEMYIGTIHSFCLRMLKEIDAKYRNFEVMDEARQAALIMTNFYLNKDKRTGKDKGLGLNKLQPQTKTGRYWDAVRYFAKTLSIIHQKDISLDKLEDKVLKDVVERYNDIAHGYPNYFFDFDQIISKLILYLKDESTKLEEIRNRFKYLVVDEYQDVDDRQEELIRLLSDEGKRLLVTAVGDDDQAIYGWRGARIQNILDFKTNYPDVQEVKLSYNFRSTHAIVEISNYAIKKIESSRIEKDMEARHMKKDGSGWTETIAEKGDIQLRTFTGDDQEAEWISQRIKQLHGTLIQDKDGTERGIDYADMVVLLRSVKSSGRALITSFEKHNIPYVVKGVGGLFDHDEVLLILAAFSLLADKDFQYQEDTAYKKLNKAETRDFIREKIKSLKENKQMPHANGNDFLGWIDRKRYELIRRELEKEERGRLAHRIYPQHIYHEMLKELGSAKGDSPWLQRVLFNLGRLSDLITQFEAVHQWISPKGLSTLCLFLGGWAAGQVDEGNIDESGTPNVVQVMTVHGAKGLEWPVVFIPRVSSANFPSNKRNHGPETFLSDDIYKKNEYASGDDGERRLWYVALTRCRKFLNITSQDRNRKKPTDFFKEIEHENMQKDGQIDDRKKGVPTPPANAELFPTTYSDLNYYWRCPFEYQLRTLMRFSPGVNEVYGYGMQIHNILAEIHIMIERGMKGAEITAEEIHNLVQKRFHLRYTRDGEKFKPFSILRNAAEVTLTRFLESYPAKDEYILRAELPFEFIDKESGAFINGAIDLLERASTTVSRETGGKSEPVTVVDFKTIKWDPITFPQRRKDVERQLQLYSVAVENAFGYDAKKAKAHFLNKNSPSPQLIAEGVVEKIEVDISENSKNQIKKEVKDAVRGIQESIKNKKFDMSGCEDGVCKACDFREFCLGYKRWENMDKVSPRPPSVSEYREEEVRFITEIENAG